MSKEENKAEKATTQDKEAVVKQEEIAQSSQKRGSEKPKVDTETPSKYEQNEEQEKVRQLEDRIDTLSNEIVKGLAILTKGFNEKIADDLHDKSYELLEAFTDRGLLLDDHKRIISPETNIDKTRQDFKKDLINSKYKPLQDFEKMLRQHIGDSILPKDAQIYIPINR